MNPNRNPNYDWAYGFVTFAEYLNMSRQLNFGIIPETKQAHAINQVGPINSIFAPFSGSTIVLAGPETVNS